MPRCNTEAMNLHLAEIAALHRAGRTRGASRRSGRLASVEPARHAAQHHLDPVAGEVHVRSSIRRKTSGSCPRDNWLSNRIFKSYADVVDHCCEVWNNLVDQPWRIMSIGLRNWAHGS